MSDSCETKSCPSKKGGSTCGGRKMAQAVQDTAIKSTLDKIKYKILVMSGKGGVGKSTMATNLALGLANQGYKVGLMDVDLHGPDICRMLNLTINLRDVKEKGKRIPAMTYNDNLKVISLEYMMENRDDAIVWRGPLKVQAIRQFVADIDWGVLDYLVIDAPPGTGDEPLAVAQNIPDVGALIVTTPQEVALADVRKSINFCKHLKIRMIGIVENMSGFVCPHCGKTVDIFKSGGGRQTALDFSIPFLGKVPMDPMVVMGGDDGAPYLASRVDSIATQAFAEVVANVEREQPVPRTPPPMADPADAACASSACKDSGCDCQA